MRKFRNFLIRIFGKENIFHYDNIISILLVIFFFFLLSKIPTPALDPIGDALEDVELTDVAFSYMGKNEKYRGVDENGDVILDTNIVLVNIGYLSRGGIAAQIMAIDSCNPKVIGVDAFFMGRKGPEDFSLSFAIGKSKKVVLVSDVLGHNPETGESTTIKHSDSLFFLNAYKTGLANTVSESISEDNSLDGFDSNTKFKIWRRFLTKSYVSSKRENEYAFSVELAKELDSSKVNKLFKRGNLEEVIDYTGDVYIPFQTKYPRFKVFDVQEILSGEFSRKDFEGKIVMMGFLGESLQEQSGEDKFYTPLNKKYIGKASRDMYGVVVHANIVSAILNELYINEAPHWVGWLFGFIVVYLTFASCRGIYNDYKVWYDGLTKIIALFICMALLFFDLYLFYAFDYKLRIPGIFYGYIMLSGDFLEVYYGFLKNLARKIGSKWYPSKTDLAE